MANDKEAQGKKLGEVIKKAWDDEAFMQRLLEDATPVLKEHGIQLPAGMKVKAVTNSDKLQHLVVPPKPSVKLSDADLNRVVAGCYDNGNGCNFDMSDIPPVVGCHPCFFEHINW
ncbi:MAG: NHLP leader peptide family RiPP precursor [Syntrophus sp. (in: bacteria)]